MDGDEISFLEEKLTKLWVKSPFVRPSDKPSLICSVWTKKTYNPNSFRA